MAFWVWVLATAIATLGTITASLYVSALLLANWDALCWFYEADLPWLIIPMAATDDLAFHPTKSAICTTINYTEQKKLC